MKQAGNKRSMWLWFALVAQAFLALLFVAFANGESHNGECFLYMPLQIVTL
jgi:hypothetical protein